MAKISKIIAREILDATGFPTLEGRLILDNNIEVKASIPSGMTLSPFDLKEIRDNDFSRHLGLGVKKAASYVNDLIAPKIIGLNIDRHFQIDQWLVDVDGTEDRSKLGVNTINLISQLTFKAAAKNLNLQYYQYINKLFNDNFKDKIILENQIPNPIFTMINGGKYGRKNLDFQEFHLIPATYHLYSRKLEIAAEIFDEIGKVLSYRNAGVSFGIEGGYTPNLSSNLDAFEVIREATTRKKYQIGFDVFFGVDIAASSLYNNGNYILKDNQNPMKTKEFLNYLVKIANEYNLLVIEDPFNENSLENWKELDEKIGEATYIVGDDLIPPNILKVKKILESKIISAVLVKINKMATIKELLELVNLIRSQKVKLIFSQRSKEVNDSLIADLSVGLQADFVKFGALCRGERVAKYNRLLEIEENLNKKT